MEYEHVHSYTAWEKLSRFLFLLLIPLAEPILMWRRGVLSMIGSVGLNLLALGLLAAWAAAETRAAGYRITKRTLEYKSGFIVRRCGALPVKSVCSLVFKEALFPAFFGAAHLFADTPAGSKKHADLALTLSRRKINCALEQEIYYQHTSPVYRASMWRILLMASSWSNPAAGLLLLAPVVNRSGKILGQEIRARLYSTVNKTLHLAAWGIPPAAEMLGNLLVAGWAAAMLVQVIRYSNFSVSVSEEYLFLQRGLITRSRQLLRRQAITALSIRQTLVMRIFKLACCYMHTAQSGRHNKHKGEKSLLFAVHRQKNLEKQMQKIFSFPVLPKQRLRPPKRALFAYILMPAAGIILLAVMPFVLAALGRKSRVFLLLSSFGIIVFLWSLAVRLLAFRAAGITQFENTLLMSGWRRVTLIHLAIPADKVQQVEVRQNLLQRCSGRCNVRVYLFSESREVFTVRQLGYNEVIDWQSQNSRIFNCG